MDERPQTFRATLARPERTITRLVRARKSRAKSLGLPTVDFISTPIGLSQERDNIGGPMSRARAEFFEKARVAIAHRNSLGIRARFQSTNRAASRSR
jgi:hypothetical protein